MNRHATKYFVLLLFGGFFLLVPFFSHALELQYSQFPIPGFSGFSENPSLGDLFNFIYRFALLLSGVLIFCSIFIFAFQFLTSSANPGKRSEAKKRLTATVVGTLLLFGTFIVLRTINPQLLTFTEQNFANCYTVSAQELTEPPALQKDDENNRIAAGLPANCPTIEVPELPQGSIATPLPPPGSPISPPNPTPTSGTCSTVADPTSPCVVANLQDAFGNSAENASMICNRESGGDPTSVNSSCLKGEICNAYAVGLFQINLATGNRCPGIITNCSSGGLGSCSITDPNAFIRCAREEYGVTLDPNNLTADDALGADSTIQIQKARALWMNGQGWCGSHPGSCTEGAGGSFCGNHPSDCSVCYLWESASSGYCNLCPN